MSLAMNATLPPEIAVPSESPRIAPRHALLTRGGWAMLIATAYVLLLLIPAMNLLLPASHPLHVSDFFVTLVGKIMCYAIVALAMDLIWGYTGILSLGHGLYFALGGYVWTFIRIHFAAEGMNDVGREFDLRRTLQ
jgi:urea transport system permease protein